MGRICQKPLLLHLLGFEGVRNDMAPFRKLKVKGAYTSILVNKLDCFARRCIKSAVICNIDLGFNRSRRMTNPLQLGPV
ncbi:hypothetical protein D3C78_1413080 [compost metagenome]